MTHFDVLFHIDLIVQNKLVFWIILVLRKFTVLLRFFQLAVRLAVNKYLESGFLLGIWNLGLESRILSEIRESLEKFRVMSDPPDQGDCSTCLQIYHLKKPS